MDGSGLEKRELFKGEDKMKILYPITTIVLLFLLAAIFQDYHLGEARL
jgi:hypothetical protein